LSSKFTRPKNGFLEKINAKTKNEFCWIVCKNGTLIYFVRSSFFGLWELAIF
jgi:hypothetical protein